MSLFQGDIIRDQMVSSLFSLRQKRALPRQSYKTWEKNTIPYLIDKDLGMAAHNMNNGVITAFKMYSLGLLASSFCLSYLLCMGLMAQNINVFWGLLIGIDQNQYIGCSDRGTPYTEKYYIIWDVCPDHLLPTSSSFNYKYNYNVIFSIFMNIMNRLSYKTKMRS